MPRIILAALLSAMVGGAAFAAPPDAGPETPQQALSSAMRQAVGAPARADLGDQAVERLDAGLLLIPKEPAAQLLTVMNREVPPGFVGLVIGSEGMDAAGIIRFVPAGFVDSDAALAWSADDLLSSLRDTVAHANAARQQAKLEPREARRWILPPRYDPETHQIAWSALILPASAPREPDGEITFHGIGFGREGYVELSVVTGVQKAEVVGQMVDAFLAGLSFRPGKAYGDRQAADRRSPSGLAGAMGLDAVHKADPTVSFWASDRVLPMTGGIVAAIGGVALIIYIQRHLRRESRRI